ncbi:MAG: aa3-type cytochrome c oxidase subunit IV [Pseudomonadota bacterium]
MTIDTSEGHEAMDYPEHMRTYAGFLMATKWATIVVIVVLALLAIFLL